MDIFLLIMGAVCAYFVCGANPAIIISRLVYKKDIRTCGSGNAGFTNFKRNFGHKWAWWVLLFDLLKAGIVIGVFSTLFGLYSGWYPYLNFSGDAFRLCASLTGLFAVIGHSYPLYYKFKGGKGFLVSLSLVWFMDWRIGLIALGVFLVLLFTVKYMSLSAIVSMLLCPTLLIITKLLNGPVSSVEAWTMVLYTLSVLLMVWRHHENIGRLLTGTEKKFYLFGKKGRVEPVPASDEQVAEEAKENE
ncbi:MAG: glycerol-3-phosphate acyltransferase [Clostridia bacterium]|nr:glycerol-3-phosphate acyltransferase [Clostridia bacterium]